MGLPISCSSRPFLLSCCLPSLSLTGFTILFLTQHAAWSGLKASIAQPHLRIHTQASGPAMNSTISDVQERVLCILARKLLLCCMDVFGCADSVNRLLLHATCLMLESNIEALEGTLEAAITPP